MSEEQSIKRPPRRHGPMGGGPGMAPGEKPKDLKGSVGKLFAYIGNYKIGVFCVMIFAVVSTVFNVVGPKVMGKATTALSEGLMNKIAQTGGIDFDRIGKILLFTLGLYVISSLFNFLQGFIMTGISHILLSDMSG